MASELKTTTSTCTTEMVQGTHTFVIENYGLKKGIGAGRFIQSGTFSVGGFDWVIRVYPDGAAVGLKGSVCLELTTKNTATQASFELRLFNHVTGIHHTMWSEATPRIFNSRDASRFGPRFGATIARDKLEETTFVNGDRLTIDCVVNVIKDLVVSETAMVAYEIEVPPSDFAAQFAKLLEDPVAVGGDVTLNVGGEVFTAHKVVLATRSPVFKAEFFGPMKEKDNGMQSIAIEDMQPEVFKVLLHFIYTDLLPEMDDLEGDDKIEIIRHLLVAADRYGMERLKLVCQSTLCKSLAVETMATTLGLAYQHYCGKLKEACIQFITPSKTMDAVAATRGYAELKRTNPSVLLDAFEKAIRRKIDISPSP